MMKPAVPRVVALDLGKARVGVAVVDELGVMAHARPFLDGKSRKALLRALAQMARDERVERFLVGLPLEMTVEAGRRLREGGLSARDQRSKIDGAAAVVILESWLRRR